MEYEKMLFHTQADKMSSANCLAPPPPTAITTSFKVRQAVSNFFASPSDPYSSYADNFDLSLLPQDSATPSEAKIPNTVFQNVAPPSPTASSTTSTASTPDIKIEQAWPTCCVDGVKQEPNSSLLFEQFNNQQQHPSQQQQEQYKKSPNQLIPPPPYPHVYPSPQSSPAQSEYGFSHVQFAGGYESLSSSRSSLYSSSPCPSLDASSIKQELHILPPSPPESSCCEAPSPHSSCVDIKCEPIDADVEALIDLNSLLAQSFDNSSVVPSTPQQTSLRAQDHQLLREYLEDTSFQRKHNLKPLALESFIGGLEEVRGDIEPVISLALEHAKREADETCAKLQISQDPSDWSPVQVHAWLRSTIAQFKLPPIDSLESKFTEDGATLVLLSEEEFTKRAPECGSILHAQLEVWKLALSDGYASSGMPPPPVPAAANIETVNGVEAGAGAMQMSTQPADGIWSMDYLNMDDNDDSGDEEETPVTTSALVTPVTTVASAPSGLLADVSMTNGSVNGNTVSAAPAKRTIAGRSGGSHIHLWQFLKELLAAPHVNGTAIRWIDRSKGIFKIEDSVRVAKLWGRRKNRPAMNYDKLSRSIRQYYKKGIMKKTERSQRLVYQFCHPYHV